VTSLATKHSDGLKMELTHLAAENQALRRQLRRAQSLATVGTITAMIVHEFNNILTPIINYAQLAAGGDEEMVRKAITKASEGGQRAVDICQALLGLLREDAPDPVKTAVVELVEQSLLATGRNLAKDGINLHLDVPANLTITTRPSEIKQVLVNLLLNARSAILSKGRSGEISIVAVGQDKRITLSLADSGTGIAPEHLDMIFEPFFTTKTGQDGQEQGNGLGLALCKEIVTNMGGEIRVETVLGKGTTFHLDLPV
jgi:signal transduction histidine kinase